MKLSDFNFTATCSRCNGSGKVSETFHRSAGAWVKGMRKEQKLTLKVVSESLGWSIGYLSDLENGRKNWSDERFAKVLKVLGASQQ
ncbi:MAG: helix-turn-helix transcriptional regulator [Pyrinomonadaceae bacterium]